MMEFKVEEVMVEDPACQGPDDARVKAPPESLQVASGGQAAQAPETGEQDAHHHQVAGEAHQSHFLGDEKIEVSHADVRINVWRTGETNPQQRVSADEDPGILVLAHPHLSCQVLNHEPFQKVRY